LEFDQLTDVEKSNEDFSDGAYILRAAWDDPMPHQYGKLDPAIDYIKGDLVE
jgi:hypothetical protein